jgi:hypothetical protein
VESENFITHFNKRRVNRLPDVKYPRHLLLILSLLLAASVAFLPGLRWGLPSRAADRFLFGDHPVWSGRQIEQLPGSGTADPDRGADVSSEPIAHRDRAVVVNATDQERARIIRRYRLMSYQPDEFATFAALARMKPSQVDLDPRMYKYGGLWVYPVGAMLKIAGATGIVQLRQDMAFYLEHPEAFGRFYVVARLYSMFWGLIGIVAVFLLVRRISRSTAAAACGALCFMFMPLVVNAAHEAKPHLAGTVLMLLAVLEASRFAERGRRRDGVGAAILSGAAIAMVPSAIPVLLVLPGMMFLRARFADNASGLQPHQPARAYGPSGAVMRAVPGLVGFTSLAIAVYFLTNPYVAINLFTHRAVLRSNAGNSSAFYHVQWGGGAGVGNAMLLIGSGASFLLAATGLAGAGVLAVRARRFTAVNEPEIRRRATGLLLALPAIAVLIPFVLLATGQPPDYARFALPVDVFLMIEAMVAIATFIRRPAWRMGCFVMLVASTGYTGGLYLRGFVRDASGQTSRMVAGAHLQGLLNSGDKVLITRNEPAPWSLPPVDLFRWRIVLPPIGKQEHQPVVAEEVTCGPSDLSPGDHHTIVKWLVSTPISWASKPFRIESDR